MATPKLAGLAKAMAMLERNMEEGAGSLLTKIESVGSRGEAAIAKSHAKLDGIGSQVGEIESYVTALEGANGGEPLDDPPPSPPPQPVAAAVSQPPMPINPHQGRARWN